MYWSSLPRNGSPSCLSISVNYPSTRCDRRSIAARNRVTGDSADRSSPLLPALTYCASLWSTAALRPPSGDSFYGRRWQVMEAGGPVRAGRVGGVNKVKFAFVCAENAPVCAPLKSRTRRVNGACTGRMIPVTIRAACVCYANE